MGIIRGNEINFSYRIYKKKEKSIDEFADEIKDYLEDLETSYAYLINLDEYECEDIDIEKINYKNIGNFLNLKDDEFAIVYYYVYGDSCYYMDNDEDKELMIETKKLCNYNLFVNFKQGDKNLRLEFEDSSGDAYPEGFIIDKNRCIRIDINDIDDVIETLAIEDFI